MAVLKRKVTGSTLIETLIALTIFIACISIATIILVEVSGTMKRGDDLKAIIELERLSRSLGSSQQSINDSIEYESFIIYAQIQPCSLSATCQILVLKAVDKKNHMIASRYEIVRRP